MPELPEVETVRRYLSGVVCDRVITDVIIRRKTLREPLPPRMKAQLTGKRITAVNRRGKYLLLEAPPLTWLAHLGMSGVFSLSPTPPREKHAHIGARLDDGKYLIYTDPRRFGRMTLTAESAEAHPWLAQLGAEPLERGFTGAVLKRALANKKTPIKNALMDGRIVAGIGNIYASEVLFDAGIRPQMFAGQLNAAQTTRLAASIKKILRRALRAGGSTLRDFVGGDGAPGYFQTQWAVYGRGGQPCIKCLAVVRQERQGGRTTYYCPRCQR